MLYDIRILISILEMTQDRECAAKNMSSLNAPSASVTCAENIALLYLLHVVPVQPTSKAIRRFERKGSRTESTRLPLKHESQLISTLSLLSSLREDVNRVTAVSVRELPHLAKLEVLIAVNKATQTAGDAYLKEVKASFKHYFSIISKAIDVFDLTLELQLFRQIVLCCQDRILSRLRFKKHKRGKQKPAIEGSLQKLLNVTQSLENETARSLIKETRQLIAALKLISNHRTTEELLKVVERSYAWSRMEDVSDLLKTIPARELSPDLYPSLRTTIGKVGQYQTAATKLYRPARQFTILRDVEVTLVKLPKPSFDRVATSPYIPSLVDTLHRIEGSRYRPELLTRLCKYMGKTPEECQSTFLSSINRTLQESKIHAEVQILIYSTILTKGVIPRLVQSNKKACYLCNALFSEAGEPGILKSHGKLYNTWRLPSLAAMKDLQVGLNRALEDQARESIGKVLKKQQKIGFPEPCESSAISSATTMSRAIGYAAHGDHVENILRQEKPSIPGQLNETPPLLTDEAKICGRQVPLGQTGSHVSAGQGSSEFLSGRLHPGQTSMVYHCRNSNFWVEYTVSLQNPAHQEPLTYHIRSHSVDANLAQSKCAGEIHDAASMEPGSEILLPLKSLYLIKCDEGIVELQFGKKHRPQPLPVKGYEDSSAGLKRD